MKKSDFLNTPIKDFDHLVQRVSGIKWWAGIALRNNTNFTEDDWEDITDLDTHFVWGSSPEGYKFWWDIYARIYYGIKRD